MKVNEVRSRLRELGNEEHAKGLQRFFKTGPGQYGEGDIFIGIRVPEMRKVLKECRDLPAMEALPLLRSPIHEERLLALLIFVRDFGKGDESTRRQIYDLYLGNRKYINNWDLVDLSAPNIVGMFLAERDKTPLYELAESEVLWDRRIAVLATFYFIKCGEFSTSFEITEMLLADKEDLIHKATGWMLREIGKREEGAEKAFLNKHCRVMPRTMLRYAIERFPEPERRMYLKGTVDLRESVHAS